MTEKPTFVLVKKWGQPTVRDADRIDAMFQRTERRWLDRLWLWVHGWRIEKF